ncbi:MAG: histidine--tRNA ligase family protein [Chloroflexi bacterium]|nr:histidine--tRNA ligase family protein [Chloroflexota bacterium]
MRQESLERLIGMRDLGEEEYLRLHRTREELQRFLTLHGYRIFESPVLETTDLFLRKSGGELAARMYTFTEPGGRRVSLRPEYTSAVIRHFIQHPPRGALPVRWQYAGPVFRYTPASQDEERQFTQLGAELIGEPGPKADAEVVAAACRALATLGLNQITVVLGHVGLLHGLLRQFSLSERAQMFLMSSVAQLRAGAEGLRHVQGQGEALGLFRSQEHALEAEAMANLPEGEAARIVRGLLASSLEHPVGSRPPEEIVARFVRKLHGSDGTQRLQRALVFLRDVAQVHGLPSEALSRLRLLVREYGLSSQPLAALERALEFLGLYELKGVTLALDLGLARGIAYYTGLVFDVCVGDAGSCSLGGGGRYDGLAKALGAAEDAPALGFAFTLEPLLRLREAQGWRGDAGGRRPRRVMVAPQAPGAYPQVLKVADALRLAGEAAEVALQDGDLQAYLRHAAARGAAALVMVDERGTSERYWVQS